MKFRSVAFIIFLLCVLNNILAFIGVGDITGRITIFEILIAPTLIIGMFSFCAIFTGKGNDDGKGYCSVNSCYYSDSPRRRCTCSECHGRYHGRGK